MTSTAAPKAPKNKAVFSATTPDGKVAYRSSARDYTHALAVFRKAEPNWDERQWVHLDRGESVPEGFETLFYGRRNGQDDKDTVFVGRRVADLPDRWSVYSFHGSAVLAEKSVSQWGSIDGYRVVEAEVVEDRRS